MRYAATAVLFLGMLAGMQPAVAGMDYGCLSACQQAGFKHTDCKLRCQVRAPAQSTNPAFPNRHGTDYRCVDRCTGTGRQRDYCLKNCSY